MMCRHKKAFTLAEVLITLLIIGIIASIVIPGLIADTQQAEFKTAWKKEYANLSQAFNSILADNGGTFKNVCPFVGWQEDSDCIMNTFKPYFSISKYCLYTAASADDCWHAHLPSAKVHQLGGAGEIFWDNNYPAMILNDGTLLYFWGGKADCSLNDPPFNNQCIHLSVDVNGFKAPNTVGKDIFIVHIFANRIAPYGVQGDGYENDCNTNPASGAGYGCSAKYLYQ
jgi:prepilin-type N-terminal cleavage/methylation domain-containing protein